MNFLDNFKPRREKTRKSEIGETPRPSSIRTRFTSLTLFCENNAARERSAPIRLFPFENESTPICFENCFRADPRGCQPTQVGSSMIRLYFFIFL